MKRILYMSFTMLFALAGVSGCSQDETPAQKSAKTEVESITIQETECNFLDVINGQPNAAICQSACETICGPGYKIAETRKFIQTNQNGIVCRNPIPNPALTEAMCDEIHKGEVGRKWCVTYNKIVNNIELGMQWQCVGALASR
ncbi:MAG: hypothetical protein ACI4PW_00720 [Alphaproteobacteria bacterium]|jgi:hypothetical protein